MLKRLFGLKFLLFALIILGVWMWLAWFWQGSFRLATVEEIVRDFIILPVAICIATWLISITAQRKWKATVSDSVDLEEVEVEEKNLVKMNFLELHDSAFLLPVGNSLTAVAHAFASDAQPGLHDVLRSESGLPVRAEWVRDLFEIDFSLRNPAQGSLFDAHVQRTLLLALKVLEQLTLRYLNQGGDIGRLHIHFLAPARWDGSTVKASGQWLESSLAALPILPLAPQVQAHPVVDSRQALIYLNDLNTRLNADMDDGIHMLLISDSFINEALVEQWDMQNLLYGFERPDEFTPGEGACGLLLSRPSASEENLQVVRLPMVSLCPGDPCPDQFSSQVIDLLKRQGVETGLVDRIFSDASDRPTDQAELMQLINRNFPELRFPGDSFALSVVCGNMAAVTPILAVALAAQHSLVTQKSCLMVSVSSGAWRAALVTHPPVLKAQPALQEPA